MLWNKIFKNPFCCCVWILQFSSDFFHAQAVKKNCKYFRKKSFKNLDSSSRLTHSSKYHYRWGINIDTSGVRVFHECTVDPAVPDTLTHLIRACTGKNTIDSCPQDYTANATISELCSSYTAMVFEPNLAYRNVHCAICNNATMDKLICLNLGPFGRFNWQQNFNTFSFAVLFDIGGNVQDSVGFISKCSRGELYDPFFKKCRNVICGREGMEFRAGKCIETLLPARPDEAPKSTSTESTTTTTLTTTRFAFTTTTTTTLLTTITTVEAEDTTIFGLHNSVDDDADDYLELEGLSSTNDPISQPSSSTISPITSSTVSTTTTEVSIATTTFEVDETNERPQEEPQVLWF